MLIEPFFYLLSLFLLLFLPARPMAVLVY